MSIHTGSLKTRVFFCAALLLGCGPSWSGQSEEAEPGRVIDYGFEQRVRSENWNNAIDFNDEIDDERQQIRYRTRVWAKIPLLSDVDFFVGLNQESRTIFGQPNHFDEVFFDSAYLDVRRFLVDGLSLRVGRQNLMKGDGFLLFEGTPGDGSRSIYHNAANLAYTFKKSKLEFIGILNPRQDRLLPRVHDQHRYLTEWDEQAVGVYYTDNNLSRTSFESYYFYKKEVNDYRAPSHPQFQADRHISTLGARIVQRLRSDVTATGEFALQWGAQRPDVTVSGWGGYGYLRKTFDNSWKPYLLGGYWAYSGDDPKTRDRHEGWDPLFARWPSWSELYIYSQIREQGAGYWTNLGMWRGEVGFSPCKPLNFRLTYYHMDALHPFPGTASVFGDGTRRGENVQARMDFAVNQHWKGHVVYESHVPGDFYHAQNAGYFFRMELIYSVSGSSSLGRATRAAAAVGGVND